MTYEIRTADLWPDADYELRAASDGFTFTGYAAVFNKPSVPMQFVGVGGGRRFVEVIEPGAFTETLRRNPDVALLNNHDMSGIPLARTSAGTMRLTEDSNGLRVEADLPGNAAGVVIRDAIARGDVRGMSFRFGSAVDSWGQSGKHRLRTVRSLEIGPEVSFATFPAYPDTAAMVRAVAEALQVNPDEVIAELGDAIGDAKFNPEQREKLIQIVNAHSDVPILDKAHVDKIAQMRERLGPPPPAA